MSELNENGNIIVSDHLVIRDTETGEVLVDKSGNSKHINQSKIESAEKEQ